MYQIILDEKDTNKVYLIFSTSLTQQSWYIKYTNKIEYLLSQAIFWGQWSLDKSNSY